MLAVYKRELRGFFYSPIAYIFMGIFLLVSGYMFASYNINGQNSDYNGMLGSLTFLFMLTIPILTMRLLSEERKNKTDQLLLTAPISLTDIVLGKYLAALSVFFVTLVISLLFPLVLSFFGNPSFVEIFSGYLGFFLVGASLIAVGVFISSLSENQVTSAVMTFGVLLLLYIGFSVITANYNLGFFTTVLTWLSLFDRFGDFASGVLVPTHIVYYISFSAVFLFLTVRTVESRRWSEV